MSDRSLAEQFHKSSGRPINIDGRKILAVSHLKVSDGTTLRVTRLTASRSRDQAVVLAVDSGHLEIDGFEAPAISLWTSTAPREVELTVRGEQATGLDIWNAWRGPAFEGAWLGNAGIVEQPVAAGFTLQCSDGIGPPDFTDLVVTVELINPGG